MTKALVLGSTGMLGSAVLGQLHQANVHTLEASRSKGIRFDALKPNLGSLLEAASLDAGDFVVNCVGLTKARIDENDVSSRQKAVRLNIDFPNALAEEAESRSLRVIQVATDCVYSGQRGQYRESDHHDALDVYGKTKSLGETPSGNVMHLRCSLIGPEQGRNSLFFEWVRQLEKGARIEGYQNHLWNGLSSITFGRVVAGVILHDLFVARTQHLVPANTLSKDELVRLELQNLARTDVSVASVMARTRVDRTLATDDEVLNSELFQAAGYHALPTIDEMMVELCGNLPNLS